MSLPDELPRTDTTRSALHAIYNWNYEPEVDELRTLYANGLERQWIRVVGGTDGNISLDGVSQNIEAGVSGHGWRHPRAAPA